MKPNGFETIFSARDYDLDATFASGQIFGWERSQSGRWSGVLAGYWTELSGVAGGIKARTVRPPGDWSWLQKFLQTEVNLSAVLATFPPGDQHLQNAVATCYGLRLLRQDPWECLAGFILSSTKQIVQIRQIVRLLQERYGELMQTPEEVSRIYGFPSPARIAQLKEADLRACKMGFRAPYLLAAAQRVASSEIDLAVIGQMPLAAARQSLLRLDGVGEKIADCVLLFAYGFPEAFPVDVWVRRVLVDYYFRGRAVREKRLRRFIEQHFGPQAGYAQQYLFHHIRTVAAKTSPKNGQDL